ncbi:MAG TPA: YbhB/YbcL family Raf kinase inhibitor-like protein [Candidatus Saccharimonadales bacterium]|nr:YbhB/YbcL family Raf kinase inhibitor-like protein [Candidatus Saccharimonadales bacterium]
MNITSSAFKHNGTIPSKYGRVYDDINPPLAFTGIPSDAESLVLIVDDPDAPGGTFTHWLIYNIPAAEVNLGEDEIPAESMEGINGYGEKGYGGPKPPSGTHRYFFKLYALDDELDLPEGVKSDELEEAIEGHVITSAELVGNYPAIR